MTQANINPPSEVGQILYVLVDQIGRLTEGLTEIRLIAEQQNASIQRLAEAQAEVAKTQAENVSRLLSLLERNNGYS